MPDVRFEREGEVARITLDRPERLNALGPEMLAELAGRLADFDGDEGLLAAVITGEGRAFCSGALRPPAGEAPTAHGNAAALAGLVLDLAHDKPVLAAIHGHAIGSGIRLALHCELLIAEKSTRLRIPEASLGLDARAFWDLLAARGAGGFADDVCLTGRFWSADEGLRAGVVHRVVDDGDALCAAMAAAQELTQLPQAGIRDLVRRRRGALRQLERAYRPAETSLPGGAR